MATEIVSNIVFFFPVKKVFFWNESISKFHKCLLKFHKRLFML